MGWWVSGSMCLTTDVIEPLRPHVDGWVWDLFRDRVLAGRDFSRDNGAVLLGKSGRKRFYERFNPLGAALRRLLRRQTATAAREFATRGEALPPAGGAGPVS